MQYKILELKEGHGYEVVADRFQTLNEAFFSLYSVVYNRMISPPIAADFIIQFYGDDGVVLLVGVFLLHEPKKTT
jgi:hypothetical protein